MKEHNPGRIHIVNAGLLPILELFPFELTDSLQSTFSDLKKALDLYGVKYDDLRKVLTPSADTWAFVFDADSLAKSINGNYVDYLITKVAGNLPKESRCVFLAGDLCVDGHNYQRYQKILEDNGVDKSLVLKTTLCAIVIINLSTFAAKAIGDMLFDEPTYLFSADITNPDINKFALSYCLIQKNIKFGRKLLYAVSEPGDACNYSGVIFNGQEYQLCPIEDLSYSIFLRAKPAQIAAPFSELKYTVKVFFDVDVVEHPKIFVSEDKLKYLAESKNINLTSRQVEQAIDESFRANQPFHMSHTGFGEEKSLNMNLIAYIDDKKYTFAIKWDLKSNVAQLITAVPR